MDGKTKTKISLGEIQETLLFPLYRRALDAKKRRSPWFYLLAARTLLRKRLNAYGLALFEASKVVR